MTAINACCTCRWKNRCSQKLIKGLNATNKKANDGCNMWDEELRK